MKAQPLPAADQLCALLQFDPSSGVLTWLPRPASMFRPGRMSTEAQAKCWNHQFAGKEALRSVSVAGYLKGGLMGRDVLAHRVAWKIYFGSDPVDIDHINGIRSDNRIVNLRSVSSSENNRNRAMPNTNHSGHVGVCWSAKHARWMAYARGQQGRIQHLGYFSELAKAVAARAAVSAALGYHANHGRRAGEAQ